MSRARIDVLRHDETVEGRSIHLFEKLKRGEISVSDLMGPLSGTPNLTPTIVIPPGDKSYFPCAGSAEFSPKDAHNLELEESVHPHNYVNPEPTEPYDLVVIGAGAAGLLSVIVGSWLGKKCALIERHGMGGDCLNTGCVPSKALIACARAIHSAKNLAQFGVRLPEGEISIDFGFVMQRMRAVRAKISHHDSVERYSREFCKHVFVGHAEFAGGNIINVTGTDGSIRSLPFRKAMIATGASAAIPPVQGLRETPHLTNGNFFNLTELPPRLLVIGCGPIGLELSQSMARFGCQVICFEMGPRLLPREDPDAAEVLKRQMEADGV
jgi:pyruvate/2-oxoglutarate dehydrogenase complex dihydrolipoamide dehydrogenase (E3) component